MRTNELIKRLQDIIDGIDNAADNPVAFVRSDLLKIIKELKEVESLSKNKPHRFL